MPAAEFIAKYKPFADLVASKTGIASESILAQAGLESGWKLNPPGNNFFGIKKGTNWTGKTVLIRTKEILGNGTTKFPRIHSITKRADGRYLYDVDDYFRAYSSPTESFADWALLVQKRFPAAWAARGDKVAFAQALAKGGYATDPSYSAKLIAVLNSVEKRLGLALTRVSPIAPAFVVAGAIAAGFMLRGSR